MGKASEIEPEQSLKDLQIKNSNLDLRENDETGPDTKI